MHGGSILSYLGTAWGCHLCDPALHDQEVRVVDIQLHRVKEVLHSTANAQKMSGYC